MAWHRAIFNFRISRGVLVSSNQLCFPCSGTTKNNAPGLSNTAVKRRSLATVGFNASLSTLNVRNWNLRCLSTKESELNWFDVDTAEYVGLVADFMEGKRPDVILIDVREPEELAESGQVPGAINIPLGTVEEALGLEPEAFMERYGIHKPSQDKDIVFNCRAGVRSLVAIESANKLGYSRARHYMRGFLGWESHLETLKKQQ